MASKKWQTPRQKKLITQWNNRKTTRALAAGTITKRQALRSKALQPIFNQTKTGFRYKTLAFGQNSKVFAGGFGITDHAQTKNLRTASRQGAVAKSGGVKAAGDRYAKAWATRVAKYGPAGARVGLRKR